MGIDPPLRIPAHGESLCLTCRLSNGTRVNPSVRKFLLLVQTPRLPLLPHSRCHLTCPDVSSPHFAETAEHTRPSQSAPATSPFHTPCPSAILSSSAAPNPCSYLLSHSLTGILGPYTLPHPELSHVIHSSHPLRPNKNVNTSLIFFSAVRCSLSISFMPFTSPQAAMCTHPPLPLLKAP